MPRVYIASSWKNGTQPELVKRLREEGHQVYDFRHPQGRNDRNVWESVTRKLSLYNKYKKLVLSLQDFIRMLLHDDAKERFEEHYNAMLDADTCILLLPCGNSAHTEAGYMAGFGKRVFVYYTNQYVKPELMYMIYDGYFDNLDELCKAVNEPIPGVCRVCGCTDANPCYHPEYGTCHWVDDTHTLCSHCASVEEYGFGIVQDPDTEHCVNDSGNAFDHYTVCHGRK